MKKVAAQSPETGSDASLSEDADDYSAVSEYQRLAGLKRKNVYVSYTDIV